MSKETILHMFKMLFIGLFASTFPIFVLANDVVSNDDNNPTETEPATNISASRSSASEEDLSPTQLLRLMQKNYAMTDYGLFFVNITPASIESFRYYHAYEGNLQYAQLVTMDGVQQEILQRGNNISYFSPTFPTFSIKANNIVDNFPSILWGDIKNITKYYDIIPVGFNRIADKVVETLRIIPKDKSRYQLVLFLDTQNKILLRQDTLDHNGYLLAQFRAVNFTPLPDVKKFISAVNNLNLPPFIKVNIQQQNTPFDWKVQWLPAGFQLIKQTVNISNGKNIETQFYSDGIFTFSINVTPSIIPDAPNKSWSRGTLTLYTRTQDNKDFTCIGDIPVATAKRIIESIKSH